jgi:hypothetical protein
LVGNEGADSPTCGELDHKCRSISQAIRNSADGDTIFVEVGVYGDLNRNGILGESGEETGGKIDGVALCFCLILVDKRVTIISEQGALATTIDASSTDLTAVSLIVTASVGAEGQGFTVLPGRGRDGIAGLRESAYISGNHVVGANGSYFDSYSDWPRYGIVAEQGEIFKNVVSGAITGIDLRFGLVFGNVVTRNYTGVFTGSANVLHNIITDNSSGLVLIAGLTTVTGNDIVRNGSFGITVRDSGRVPAPHFSVVISDNNIIGNGYVDPATRCGLINDSRQFVWAADNYWGALGESDRVCNRDGSSTAIEPVRLVPDARVQ